MVITFADRKTIMPLTYFKQTFVKKRKENRILKWSEKFIGQR